MQAKLRPWVFGISLIVASFALYLGIFLYLVATDPKFPIADRNLSIFKAQCLILTVIVLDVMMAWMIPRRYGIFLVRLVLAVILNVSGAIWAFGLIFARAQLFNNT